MLSEEREPFFFVDDEEILIAIFFGLMFGLSDWLTLDRSTMSALTASSRMSSMTPDQLEEGQDMFFVIHEDGCPMWDSKFELGNVLFSVFKYSVSPLLYKDKTKLYSAK